MKRRIAKPHVFDPGKRPWVTMDGASTEAIVGQVAKCPSGALSSFRDADGPERKED